MSTKRSAIAIHLLATLVCATACMNKNLPLSFTDTPGGADAVRDLPEAPADIHPAIDDQHQGQDQLDQLAKAEAPLDSAEAINDATCTASQCDDNNPCTKNKCTPGEAGGCAYPFHKDGKVCLTDCPNGDKGECLQGQCVCI